MVAITNSPAIDIQSNIDRVEKQWHRFIQRFRPNLLENMRLLTYLLKDTVATSKLQGQVLNRRTGKLIQSLLPNDPEQAGRIEGGNIVGTVGAQASIAPYARPLEEGAQFPVQVGAGTRGGFGARGGSLVASWNKKVGKMSLRQSRLKTMSEAEAKLNAYMHWANKNPEKTVTRIIRARWYIKDTIKEKQSTIKFILSRSTGL